jgi:hypothetical protein
MRAMSLGLIKGTIDEVDQIVQVTYIKVTDYLRLSVHLTAHGTVVRRCAPLRTVTCALCRRVRVCAIQPRVLSTAQIASLKDRTQAWSDKVKSSLLFVEEHTRELFA